MLLHSVRSEQLSTLAGQVRAADDATSEMLVRTAVESCQRLSTPNETANAARLRKLIDAGASTEAAIALIELDLPQWKLRRVTYDEGEWHCAVSRQRELPDWLDQAVEASHESLTLAILSVYVETLRQVEASRVPGRPSVPQIRVEQYDSLCCGNFV